MSISSAPIRNTISISPPGGTREDAGDVAPALAGHQAEIEAADPRRRRMQDVEAVPVVADQAEAPRRARARAAEHRRAVGPGQRALAEDQHRALRLPQRLGEADARRAPARPASRARRRAPRPGRSGRRAAPIRPTVKPPWPPALAQARVDERRLPARVGADQQAGVGLLDAGDRRVEQIAGAARGIEPGAVLAAVDVRASRAAAASSRTSTIVSQSTRSPTMNATLRPSTPSSRVADRGERLAPVGRAQLAVPLDHRHVEAAPLQPVIGEAALVGDPLLVHVLVEARQDAHHLAAAGVDADVAADRVE